MAKSVKKETIITISIATVVLVATLLSVITTSSLAYFRAIFDKTGSHNIMVELIFDRLKEEGFTAYQTKYTDVYGADFNPNPTAEWGTRENPYVISEKYHVQNLSVLQNAGFFEKIKDANGNPRQAYFLVCNPDGTPVVVDCNGMTIAPIGTDALPFTGVIHGAPAEGEDSYKGYGASISGIANLTVKSTLDEPDLGFFGKLGYYGTKEIEQDSFGNDYAVITDGYAAQIQDLLLADVTISSRRSLAQTLTDWWNSLTGHINYKDAWKETHHVGIITGHAEFATIKDVSVYYSNDSVPAFDLISNDNGSNTNYYSATGLIGLLDCVNPTIGSNGVLDGSNAVSDSALVGDGSNGGGGDESGTMTGYFLAKNLYDRHESHLSANEIKDKYSVTEMTDADGKALFETVTMREREVAWEGLTYHDWNYRNYFYFQDTVFTFAMSMSVKANSNGVAQEIPDESHTDYVQKIWKDLSENNRPSLSATDSLDKLEYGFDPNADARVSYTLTAVAANGNTFTLNNNDLYVLAYHDKGSNLNDTSDDKIYLLNLNLTEGSSFSHQLTTDDIAKNTETGLDEITYSFDGDITSMKLIGNNLKYYNYSILYESKSKPIRHPSDDLKFGVRSNGSNGASSFKTLITTLSDGTQTGGSNYALLGKSEALLYEWTFASQSANSTKVAIVGEASIGKQLIGYAAEGWQKLACINGSFKFEYDMNKDSNNRTEGRVLNDNNYFTIFKLNANNYDTSTGKIISLGDGNESLVPMNIYHKPEDELYNFDPSKYVLQYVGTSTEGDYTLGNYKLVPIRSLKLNDGMGNLLEEINHVTSLYKSHKNNYTLSIGNILGGNIGSILNDYTGTNSGGIVNVTIGTKDIENAENEDNLYSIPTGMIAFEINKASVDDPSYINIIVAIIPNMENIERQGTVGVWKREKESWRGNFSIDDAIRSVGLPISSSAKGNSDKKNAIKVIERIEEQNDNGKRVYNVVQENGINETSYMYLGGNIALVSYTFEITETGIYMIGSQAGPLSVAYFSVTGAAGAGNDGMSGSPLGNIDFVYDFNNKIITTDKHFEGSAPLINLEDHENYYPSYLFVGMLPGENEKIQYEVIKIRRYIDTTDNSGTKRHIAMTGEDKAEIRGVSPIMEDYQDDIDSN